MRRLTLAVVASLHLLCYGCGGGSSEPITGNAPKAGHANEALPKSSGIPSDMAEQAAQGFHRTQQMSPELRKQFEAAARQLQHQPTPQAQQRPSQR